MSADAKVGKVRRWNCLRSALRHQGIFVYLMRRWRRA
jgi:hypothetical protein